MFYPNFSRRTLALILSCLVITLGGVGLLFLIYIFNETSSLLSGPLEKISHNSQPYKQGIIISDEHKFEKKFRNQSTQEINGNISKGNLYKNGSRFIPKPSDSRTISFSTIRLENNKIQPVNLSTKDAKTTEINLDTIYIDDFDRPTYNQKSKTGIDNIDYFDVLLVDHEVDKKLNTNNKQNNTPNNSIRNTNVIFEAINNNNKKRKKNKKKSALNKILTDSNSKILLTEATETKNSSSEDSLNLSDTDNTGSGSGDYTDDTEITEVGGEKFHNGNNIANLLQKRIKKKHGRWKHPYKLFEDYIKSTSSVSRLTTLSYANSNYVKGRGSAELFLQPNISQFTGQIIVDPYPKEKDKEVSPSNNIAKYTGSYYNDSYPLSSTFQYNNELNDNLRIVEFGSTADSQINNSLAKTRENDIDENNESWIKTRTRRIMENVKKSEERSRQLLLCEEAGGGELCRMLFKEHVNN